MLNDKLRAARKIRSQLIPSEQGVDTSIIHSARLLISIVEARLETGAPVQVGHAAMLRANAGLNSLIEARDHIVACHQELAVARDDNGLSSRAVGCTPGKPDAQRPPNGLRVATAA